MAEYDIDEQEARALCNRLRVVLQSTSFYEALVESGTPADVEMLEALVGTAEEFRANFFGQSFVDIDVRLPYT